MSPLSHSHSSNARISASATEHLRAQAGVNRDLTMQLSVS